jgi:hypothetical protein
MIVARRRWLPVAMLAVASLAGVLSNVAPTVGTGAVSALVVIGFAALYPSRIVRFAVAFIGFLLFGYAFAGKGFAYLGRSPVFIGEVALALGILALIVRGGIPAALRSPLSILLIAFSVWCATQTVPYLDDNALDALRDAALWGYGAFALIVAGLLNHPDAVPRVLSAYWRYFRWLPFWAPAFGVVSRVASDMLPRVPGTDVPFFYYKPGDIAVHLGAVAVFLVLGLQRTHPADRTGVRWDWVWWGLWVPSVVIAVATSRGGFLSVVGAFSVVLALRPRSRWWKPAVVATVLGVAFFASNITIDVGLERKISARQLVANIVSIQDSKQDISLSGTREWRLAWWGDIVDYTIFGKYRWTGKGFGVNLADDDGYQAGVRDYVPNRSPHNVQMTVLARAGVPGLLLWVALQVAFVLTLVRAFRRARRAGWDWWARANLWILAYWIALLVNGTFDVYLEGPQGGIWFWSIFGLGIAAVDAQRRLSTRAPYEAMADGDAVQSSAPRRHGPNRASAPLGEEHLHQPRGDRHFG